MGGGQAAGRTSRLGRLSESLLAAELQAVHGKSDVFQQIDQAEAVLRLVFDAALPAYREFHRDLLFHQTDEGLFQPFFIGRVCEAVLRQGGPWDETDRIVSAALHQLNDYLGHRPVAVLRTEQKIQPYDHEWVRPIPLWIRGAGVAFGPYRELIETALAILDATDPTLRFDAMFAIEQLDELALDPRAYDFDHPANKRPNYLFGQWDMNQLDNAGRCRRFVLQQVTLDAMLDRLEHRGRLSRKQVLFEEAAVLAGTMLMGSGVSGDRPDAHDSAATLATLVQKIAVYRDAFYEQLLQTLKGSHAERLRAEAVAMRQPFGGARQHFNHYLARRRALQLQHVHLAQLFAAIGYTEAAARQAAVVPVASARMTCEMRCRMAAAHLAVERGDLAAAASQLPPIEDLLRRAIECGAMVDPWNILGFGGQYSLFPAVENSVYDHRIDELLDMMSDIFMLYVRIHKAAAAAGDLGLQAGAFAEPGGTGPLVGSVRQPRSRLDRGDFRPGHARIGRERGRGAAGVARRGRRRRRSGLLAAATSSHFRSPKAYALVIDTLLDRRDPGGRDGPVGAMAQPGRGNPAGRGGLFLPRSRAAVDGGSLGRRTNTRRLPERGRPPASSSAGETPAHARQCGRDTSAHGRPVGRWPASSSTTSKPTPRNTGRCRISTWPPRRWATAGREKESDDEFADEFEDETNRRSEPDDEDDLFGAAYEDVTYRDSTDDGVEGEIFESGENATDFELVGEAERIVSRLSFLTTVAQLWKLCATASRPGDAADRDDVLAGWLAQADRNRRQLLDLLASVQRHRIPPPHGTQESLVEYDRRRSVKETLLEEIIQACVETGDAARMIRASMARPSPAADVEGWEQPVGEALAALVRGDAAGVRAVWPKLLRSLAEQPLLYVALGRGGSRSGSSPPDRSNACSAVSPGCLPRLGLLTETCQLLETAHTMEITHPVGPGGDHRVRSRVRDRLQGRHPVSGDFFRRLARTSAEQRRARSRRRDEGDGGGCRRNAVRSQDFLPTNSSVPCRRVRHAFPARPTPD